MSPVHVALIIPGLAFLIVTRISTLLSYFQQEEYDSSRFIKALFRIPLVDILGSLLFLLAAVAHEANPGLGISLTLTGSCALALIAVRERRYQFKKKVVATDRLRRLRRVAIGLATLSLSLPFLYLPLGLVALQLPALAIVLANLLLAPVQRRIDQRYVDEAREKLAAYSGVRIGITGSFGKTTVKHLIGDLLGSMSSVHFSRGSVNTVLGLTRHIRERLQPGHRFLIAEMGAYGEGSIKRLCEFIQPTIGVITAIGDAHAERFGSRGAVGRAKGELAEWVVGVGGTVVISDQVAAFEPVATLLRNDRGRFLVCGPTEDCDIIVGTRLSKMSRTVELTIRPLQGRRLYCEIPSLGEYEALNVALAAAVITKVCPDLIDQLPFLLPNIGQVSHRLEVKELPGQPLVLDDAYNSNETGFRNAVDVMRTLADERNGRAILITPGVIELGAEHDAVHSRLGEYCASRCDVAIVVNPDRIKSFVRSFGDANPERLIKAATLAEARQALGSLSPDRKDVVLYENDLPDLHEGKRIL